MLPYNSWNLLKFHQLSQRCPYNYNCNCPYNYKGPKPESAGALSCHVCVAFQPRTAFRSSLDLYDFDTLKITGQLLCRTSLSLGLYVSSLLDSGYTSLAGIS